MTVKEACEALGLKTWDGALPQTWLDDFYAATGFYPFGAFVWCYDYARSGGEPFPLTPEAVHWLIVYTMSQAAR